MNVHNANSRGHNPASSPTWFQVRINAGFTSDIGQSYTIQTQYLKILWHQRFYDTKTRSVISPELVVSVVNLQGASGYTGSKRERESFEHPSITVITDLISKIQVIHMPTQNPSLFIFSLQFNNWHNSLLPYLWPCSQIPLNNRTIFTQSLIYHSNPRSLKKQLQIRSG